MPLQETSGAASYDAFGGGAAAVPQYIEDVFSTYLYTGNGSARSITNNIDLSTKGGLVWIKDRPYTPPHLLIDTIRGGNKYLKSNATTAETTQSIISAFNTTGFSLTADTSVGDWNWNGDTYVSWTFRKQPKFFDVVTFTTEATNTNQRISHSLGSVPGCIIVKRTDGVDNWFVWHRSLPTTTNDYLYLNTTAATQNTGGAWGATGPTATDFGVNDNFFGGGRTMVAYLFAHNAGGFGLTGTDNVISCGSYTASGSSGTVTLGYEPQWVLIKNIDNNASGIQNWQLIDNMRGMPVGSNDQTLYPNLSDAEASSNRVSPTATGFSLSSTSGNLWDNGAQYIYIAIRRGPMKVPTSGTGVFQPVTRTGTGTNATVTNSSISYVDFLFSKARTNTAAAAEIDRLRGNAKLLYPRYTDAETTIGTGYPKLDVMNGYTTDGVQNFNQGSTDFINYFFKRAPSFFDVVCYTGDGTGSFNVNHNLGITPEMAIIKRRNAAAAWPVFFTNTYSYLNQAFGLGVSAGGLSGRSTSTTINVGTLASLASTTETNASGSTYVVYLFATCAGVSKVGSYTGTGSLQTINCGFTTGARFVMIKRTDSSADWYYWDSARGITSGSDPYLIMNSDAAEVNATNYVDTDSTGFKVTAAAPSDLNASGGTYLFLAIA